MAKSNKKNYKSVVKKEKRVNVTELNNSELNAYIEENYAPFIVDSQMIFGLNSGNFQYDYKGDSKEVVDKIIEHYKSIADYTEETLPQETIYEIQDWNLVRRDIEPETDEVIGESDLKQITSDNSYNFSYRGLVDLDWIVYHDEDYDRYFYVIHPHLGGDIRGNYGEAIIIEGNDKDELFYRFYEGFISGVASIYLKFNDGSEIGFDSEQDSDVFKFRLNEVFKPTGIAKRFLQDFKQFDSWYGDEFLENTIDIYLLRKGITPKMMSGGSLDDETPKAHIEIVGYDEGKWINLSDFSDGMDVIDHISDWMNELNKKFGGNREEYRVSNYEGFGDNLYDEYMGENEFDEIIESYESYKSSDFPSAVIYEYKNDSGNSNNSLSEIIERMDTKFFGKYDNLRDFGYEMVEKGVYTPSDSDVYMNNTNKSFIAGEESDSLINAMNFQSLLNVASDTKYKYEKEKKKLQEKIEEIKNEISNLTELQSSTDEQDEFDNIAEQIEEKELMLEEFKLELNDIDSRYENEAKDEAKKSFYDEIYSKLENDLSDWLKEHGYTEDLENISFLSVNYEKIGKYLSSNYLIIEYDGKMYFFNNYEKGGRITAKKRKPKFPYYIVESSTKKLVSGYNSKEEALEQRRLLVQEYPSMRFEIFTLGNLEAKTQLDVNAKKDYVELSTLDKIKKVSVDAYRYGKEKVGQAQMFLEKNDVKGKIKRGARNVWEKTKEGGNWIKRQWEQADFGDGKGKAKFFADGGELPKGAINYLGDLWFAVQEKRSSEYKKLAEGLDKLGVSWRIQNAVSSDAESMYGRKSISVDEAQQRIKKILNENGITKYDDGGGVDFDKINKANEIYREHNLELKQKGLEEFTKESAELWDKGGYYERLKKLNLTYEERTKLDPKKWYSDGGQPIQYVPVQAIPQQPVQYVPVQQVQQPNSPMGNLDLNTALNFLKENPQVLTMLEKGGEIKKWENSMKKRKDIEFLRIEKTEALPNNRIMVYYAYNPIGKDEFKGTQISTDVIKYADGGTAQLGEVSGMFPTPLPMSIIQPMETGGVANELAYIDNRIHNLEEMVSVMNEEDKPSIYSTINELKEEKSRLLSGDIKQKKSWWFFKEGGETSKKENHDYDVYDNKRMLENQANEIEHHSEELNNQVKITNKVPAWVIAKMERATTDLSDITHYLDGENKMADGGEVDSHGNKYEIVPLPSNKFAIATILKDTDGITFYRNTDGTLMKFDDIKSAKNYLNNVMFKFPYGVPKANVGALLLASQLLQGQQQQQQPQVIYYVPQQPTQEVYQQSDIVQNIPQMEDGGIIEKDLNDFCINQLVGLANDLQPVKYYVTQRYDEKDLESKNYKGKLIILFKEPVMTGTANAINEFIIRAEDCQGIFEEGINVSGSQNNSLSIYLKSDVYSDTEMGRGGKVYDYAPKKINLEKTKKITTQLGDYVLGLVTKDFVYFVNLEESDDNGNTIMYNKNGELLSDNYFANSDLYDRLTEETDFEFIHPSVEYNRQEIIKQNS